MLLFHDQLTFVYYRSKPQGPQRETPAGNLF